MRQIINIVKIGGNVIDFPDKLTNFLNDFASITGPKILVHGGGKTATTIADKLGIESKFIEGRRVTSKKMIKITLMVYAGLINKEIVATLCAKSCPAIGLTGADASVIMARKRSPEPVDYGEVGDIDYIDTDFITKLIDSDITPVFCSITSDNDGHLLNTNADTVAVELAIALASVYDVRLIYCFEKDGVMSDGTVIPQINSEMFEELKNNGTINSGMIPKITNALRAAKTPGVLDVNIRNAEHLLYGSGTYITD